MPLIRRDHNTGKLKRLSWRDDESIRIAVRQYNQDTAHTDRLAKREAWNRHAESGYPKLAKALHVGSPQRAAAMKRLNDRKAMIATYRDRFADAMYETYLKTFQPHMARQSR